jgi:hypothetical protein
LKGCFEIFRKSSIKIKEERGKKKKQISVKLEGIKPRAPPIEVRPAMTNQKTPKKAFLAIISHCMYHLNTTRQLNC